MNLTLLVNPAARGGIDSPAATHAADRLRAAGHVVTLIGGGSADESSGLIAAAIALGTQAVVVVGGDGTVGVAVQLLAGTGIPLGVIPAGTGNDFAGYLGIPELRPERAADIIAAGHTRTLDLARVTRNDASTRLYATVLASGFDSYVNDRANRMRWPRGEMRYNIAILMEFLFLRATPYVLHIDGTRIDGPFVMASVGNTRSYGGGIPICVDADASDGLLDITVVRPAGRLRLLRLMPKVFQGKHAGHPQVQMFRGRSVRLEAAGLTAYADGDPIARLPVTIDVVPRALLVFAPL